MNNWSLEQLLAGLHDNVENSLAIARKTMGHPVAKGDASEAAWHALLREYLPERYAVQKAFVVDSKGAFSDQMDVVILDRQYSPLIFKHEGQIIVPAESVYAVFETKQAVNAEQVNYAQDKVESVRKLYRTSLPIPHAGGTFDARVPQPILGGILAFESDWKPPMDKSLETALLAGTGDRALDIGCIAAHGTFWKTSKGYDLVRRGKPATAFLLELVARLQALATVPMLDVRAYAAWLPK